MFGNIAHNVAEMSERNWSAVIATGEEPLKLLAEITAICLDEMDAYLLKGGETDEDCLKYMNDISKMACAGILGYRHIHEIDASKVANQMVDTYKRKNADYGDSFGASLDKYGPVAAHVRMSDKVNRLQSLVVRKQTAQVKDESIADTFLDLACYAIMRLVYIEMKLTELDEEKEEE